MQMSLCLLELEVLKSKILFFDHVIFRFIPDLVRVFFAFNEKTDVPGSGVSFAIYLFFLNPENA